MYKRKKSHRRRLNHFDNREYISHKDYLKRFDIGYYKKTKNYERLFNLNNIYYNKTFKSEHKLVDWFKDNANKLGCRILSETKFVYPDAIIQINDIIIRTEFEILSSNFIIHGHDPNKVDIVICIHKDVDLSIDTLVLPFNGYYWRLPPKNTRTFY
jgi:hypothetical protein